MILLKPRIYNSVKLKVAMKNITWQVAKEQPYKIFHLSYNNSEWSVSPSCNAIFANKFHYTSVESVSMKRGDQNPIPTWKSDLKRAKVFRVPYFVFKVIFRMGEF